MKKKVVVVQKEDLLEKWTNVRRNNFECSFWENIGPILSGNAPVSQT